MTALQYGGPGSRPGTAHRGADDAPTSTALAANDLNRRLGSNASSGRAANWRVAIREYRQHPWLGSGAGTYERFWLRYRPNTLKVRDAHSLYLETLAQLGWPGLAFVVLLLGVPLLAAVRAAATRASSARSVPMRRTSCTPGSTGTGRCRS